MEGINLIRCSARRASRVGCSRRRGEERSEEDGRDQSFREEEKWKHQHQTRKSTEKKNEYTRNKRKTEVQCYWKTEKQIWNWREKKERGDEWGKGDCEWTECTRAAAQEEMESRRNH